MRLDLCPNCGGYLRVRKKVCAGCDLGLEADFEENPLSLLAREEQEFLLDFILCGGSFKALGERLGLTYPTVRVHFDRIRDKLETIASTDSILDAIERGDIRPEEGVEKLKRIRRGRPKP